MAWTESSRPVAGKRATGIRLGERAPPEASSGKATPRTLAARRNPKYGAGLGRTPT